MKGNFGIFIETLLAEGRFAVLRNGLQIPLCRATEEEMQWLERHREKRRIKASNRLSRILSGPPCRTAEAATAPELMELLEIDEAEARELFPEKFTVE